MNTRISLKTSLIALAAASMAFAPAAPVLAGGGHHHGYYGGHGYRHGHHGYGNGYYRHGYGSYYYGSRHYRHYHHHGLSGGEAALLAAGIIGGAILIDRAVENGRARDAYYYDRGYAPSYRGGYDRAPSRDFYYRRDDRAGYDDEALDDDFDDDGLAGGETVSARSEYNYGAAYNDCKAETRDAARDSGLLVALPARPQSIDAIDGGSAVRFSADIIARDVNGAEYRRVMTCEADKSGVRFLEIA